MQGISSKAVEFGHPENKYRYNGIAQNSEFDLNIYEAFYRNHDPQIGRFWQVDPDLIHAESPYAAMQNSPILKMDWLGNHINFHNDNELETTYKNLRDANNSKLAELIVEIVNVLMSDEKGKAIDNKVKNLTKVANMHASLNAQWNAMEDSGIEFNVTREAPPKGSGGGTRYNMVTMEVDIKLGGATKNIGAMAHEFRHGYGYLVGEAIGGSNELDDQMDEIEAYKVQFLFGTQDSYKMVVNDKVGEWFKANQLNTPLYNRLIGKEEQLTLNTPAATIMKYYPSGLIGFILKRNNYNSNLTAEDAASEANSFHPYSPVYRFGTLLEKK